MAKVRTGSRLAALGGGFALVVPGTVAAAPAERPGPRATPTAVAFWTARDGLLAAGSRVYRTVDGGRSWVTAGHVRGVTRLAVAGTSQVWAIARRHLYGSTDGGRTFIQLATPTGMVADASFVTPSVGWAVRSAADRPRLVATVDGGRRWHGLRDPCPRLEVLGAIRRSARRGFVLCVSEPGAGNQGKRVVATADGGRTWHVRTDVPFATNGADRTGLGLYGYPIGLAGSKRGRVYLWESRGRDFASSDGARHWSALAVQRPETDFTKAISAPSTSDMYLPLMNGTRRRDELLRSTDAGQTWTVVATFRWP